MVPATASYEASGQRGDAGKALEEIQGRPLRRVNGGQVTPNLGQQGGDGTKVSSLRPEPDMEIVVHGAKGFGKEKQTGRNHLRFG